MPLERTLDIRFHPKTTLFLTIARTKFPSGKSEARILAKAISIYPKKAIGLETRSNYMDRT